MANEFTIAAVSALQQFNSDYNTGWNFGTNWSSVGTKFETYVNKYFFPKINETKVIDIALGNRFNWLAKEVDYIGQYSEEYVIMDNVPVNMNLSKNAELMFKRNYPRIATKLYGAGMVMKQKFTLNNNDVRQNFLTLADAVTYAIAVYKKAISDINVAEESHIKGMIVDYFTKIVAVEGSARQKREVTSLDDLVTATYTAMFNIQNNSHQYNEAFLASGGEVGRYSTTSKLKNTLLLTTDEIKTFLLDTKIGNTFQTAGIDPSKRIMSFDDLGGNWKLTSDVTIQSTDTIKYLQSMGDYQVEIGDIIPEGSLFTYDMSRVIELEGNVEEVKPSSDLFVAVMDINSIRYKRSTKGMHKAPFNNGEHDETTHWLHYYSSKQMSPFYNKILITG